MSAVTERLAYVEKPSAVDSKAYTHSALPVNGTTFQPGSIVRIDIPTSGRGTYLDSQNSYLKFKITNTSTTTGGAGATITVDSHASSFINRCLVSYSGYTLEDISEYGQLHSILFDNNISFDERKTIHAISAGCAEADSRAGADIATGASLEVFFPLISSIVGLNADKYIPLGKLTASDSLRLELTLESAGIAVKTANSTDTGTFTISDVEYVASMVALSDEAENMVSRATGGTYRVHGDSYRAYNANLQSGVSLSAINIPVKVSSLKTLFVSHRKQSNATGKDTFSITNRDLSNLQEYYFTIGSNRLPQKPVKIDTNCSEALMELMKSTHQLGHKRAVASFVLADWKRSDATASQHGAFVIGMDMESFSGKSDTMNQGVSTISQPLFFNGTYSSTPAAMVVTAFAHYDQVLEIDVSTGIARVMF